MDKLLTPDEVAGILSVSRRTAYRIMLCIIDLKKCSFNNRHWDSNKPIETPYLCLDGGTDDD